MANALLRNRIKHLREQLGLTQYEFGKKIGLPPQHISLYETGRMEPRARTLRKMINVFRLDPGYFFAE